MKSPFLFTLATACAIALCSCQSSTPSTRIEKHPDIYQALTMEQKKLVSVGQLQKGMGPQAVFIAWGYPNNAPYKGEKDGKNYTRWIYTQDQPVTTVNNWSGSNWGPYGWYDNGLNNYATTFIPKKVASVNFENDKVISWVKQTSAL